MLRLLCVMMLVACAIAQAPDSLWMLQYGVPDASEFAGPIVLMPDSGYMAFGRVSGNPPCPWIVRFDYYGDTLWTRRWESDADRDIARAVRLNDDQILIAGSRYAAGRYQSWLRLVDEQGMPSREVVSDTGYNVFVRDVYVTHDEQIVLAGTRYSNWSQQKLFAVKLNSELDTIWAREYGEGGYMTSLTGVTELPNGELVFVGKREVEDYYEYPCILRTTADGTEIWSTIVTSGPDAYRDYVGIVARADGGFVIVAANFYSSSSLMLRVMNADNAIERLQEYLCSGGYITISEVLPTANGNLLIAGSQETNFGSRTNVFAIGATLDGDTIWQQSYGSDQNEVFGGIAALANGDFIASATFSPHSLQQTNDLALFRTGTRALRFDPTAVDFGTQSLHRSSSVDFWATNALPQGVRIVSAMLPPGFSLDTALPLWFSPYSQRQLRLSFLPTDAIEYDGELRFQIDLPQRWLRLPVIGAGTNGLSPMWRRTFGTALAEECYGIAGLANGDFVAVGSTIPEGSALPDAWIVRCNSRGEQRWAQNFGGMNADVATDVIKTSDGGYAVVGYTNSYAQGSSDFLFLKYYANNVLQFSHAYGGISSDRAQAIVQTPDGGYAIAGTTVSFGAGGNDFWLLRLDVNGDTLWTRTFGGQYYEGCQGGNSHDGCEDLIITRDGNFVLAGWTSSFQGHMADGLIIKVSQLGDSIWNYTVGGAESNDSLFSVTELEDGQLVFAGYSRPTVTDSRDFWAVGTLESGELSWSNRYGGAEDQECYDVKALPSGYLLFTGLTQQGDFGVSDGWLVKTTSWGDTVWTQCVGEASEDELRGVDYLQDMSLVLGGSTASSGSGSTDFWVVSLTADCVLAVPDPVTPAPREFALLYNYPNPFNAMTTIRFDLAVADDIQLSIYNLNGALVHSVAFDHAQPGRHEVRFDGGAYASGLYFVQVRGANVAATAKMILLK